MLAPLNAIPCSVSVDQSVGDDDSNPLDRVRGFNSLHPSGANFAFVDGSVHFIAEDVDSVTYRHLSTIDGSEVVSDY